MRTIIEKLIARENLTAEECRNALRSLLAGVELSQGAAFLTLMRSKGETVEELVAVCQEMQAEMVSVPITGPVLDIVGTGGDGANTVNISTGSALLAASCGAKVAKHGNRSVSSRCGAADVLEKLGVKIDHSLESALKAVEQTGFVFLFAPLFHPALASLRQLRKGLGVRTLFNLVGPLVNPARAGRLMVGVSDLSALEKIGKTLQVLGVERALVFHGQGLDELSTLGPCMAIEVTPDSLTRFEIDPQAYGFPKGLIEDLRGGDPEFNAERLLAVFRGEKGTFADTLVLNAGFALYLSGLSGSIEGGILRAKEKLAEGAPLKLLENCHELSH